MVKLLFIVTTAARAMGSEPKYEQARQLFSDLADGDCLMRHWRDIALGEVERLAPLAIIHSGGPASQTFPDEPIFHDQQYRQLVEQTNCPQLAICRAFQVISTFYGGRVAPMPRRPGLIARNDYWYESGLTQVSCDRDDPIWRGVTGSMRVYQNHRNEVTKLPPGFARLASNDLCSIQAWSHPHRLLYGVQFHPERGPTPDGLAILRAFLAIARGSNPNNA